MNAQNSHITQKLAEAQAAVSALIEAGMTVVDINIEGRMPRINLLHGPRRIDNSMPVCWKAIRPRANGNGRECEMGASFNGCEVRWKEEHTS